MVEADEEKKMDKKEEQENEKSEGRQKKSFMTRFIPKIIIMVVVVVFAGVGFTLGRLFGPSSADQTPGTSESDQSSDLESLKAKGSEEDSEKTWFYNMEPVIANLNVSDVTRYVKASLILEISSEVDEKKGIGFLEEKLPILRSWLNVYLASLGLDDIRGDANLKRIQAQVLDAFNERLFPDSKPQVKRILFKEFAVQ
jgi:flagellar basal body-associated protein FliL